MQDMLVSTRKQVINLQFEYYVLNYDCNKKKVENFNIFRNCLVQEHTEKAVRKYLRNPKNYKYVVQHKNDFLGREEIAVYGFDALVKEIDSIIKWCERSKKEYEISVGDAFATDINKLEKQDTYYQAHPNAEIIAYTVIRQYKEQLKNE